MPGQKEDLEEKNEDSEEIETSEDESWDAISNGPKNALKEWNAGLGARISAKKRKGIFLDYDGTLTPIVSNPEDAIVSDTMRRVVRKLSEDSSCSVAVVSGRSLPKIRQFLRIDTLHLSGSHGAEIHCPPTASHPKGRCKSMAEDRLDDLLAAQKEISELLPTNWPGCAVEDNKYCFSIHYRKAVFRSKSGRRRAAKTLRSWLETIAKKYDLRVDDGKLVFEIRPQGNWDKGVAVCWLIKEISRPHTNQTLCPPDRAHEHTPSCGNDGETPDPVSASETDETDFPDEAEQTTHGDANTFYFYCGDDVADEKAFEALNTKYPDRSATICVSAHPKPTKAKYWLKDPSEVYEFLSLLLPTQRSDLERETSSAAQG